MSVVPVWRALAALGIGAVLGGAVLSRAGLRWGAAETLVRALLGLALAAAFTVHVALGLALTLAVVWLTARERGAMPETAATPIPRLAFAATAAVGVVAALRPPVPLFWDESVWLSKARVACDGPVELMARALDPHSVLVPRGYSVVAAVLEASFAIGDPDLPSLVAGGAALVIACFALFALLLARGASSRDERATLLVLAATPLAWVHVQSVQLDLPIGLLTASLVLAIERAERLDRIGLPAAMTAALLLGIKDEGLACALAVLAAVLLTSARRGAGRRAALASCAALALSTITYRLELWAAGSQNDDHSFVDLAASEIPGLAREALRHAVDVDTWGIVPPIALAAAVLAFRPATREAARTAALALLFVFAGLALALLVGPPQVRAFALEGTLLNRLGLELLPLAAVLVPRACFDGIAPTGALPP